MRKFLRFFTGAKQDLRFSYEEQQYSLGVKVLILFLTIIILMLAERALADLSDGIPRIQYPNQYDLQEHRDIITFQRDVLNPLYTKRSELERGLIDASRNYDTGLLEEIAGERNRMYGGKDVSREEFRMTSTEMDELQAEIDRQEKEYKRLQELAYIAEKPIRSAYEQRVRMRQLYVFLWEALFWLPFFFFALWWFSRTKRNDSRWEVVAISVLIAASIISIQSFCVFLWSWIPKEFLEWLWELLRATLLTRIVGYYLIMAFVVLLLGSLAVSVHRRAQNPVRGGKRKICNGMCPQCSYPLSFSAAFCGGCGRELKKKCNACKKDMYKWEAACTYCGKKQLSTDN